MGPFVIIHYNICTTSVIFCYKTKEKEQVHQKRKSHHEGETVLRTKVASGMSSSGQHLCKKLVCCILVMFAIQLPIWRAIAPERKICYISSFYVLSKHVHFFLSFNKIFIGAYHYARY